MKRMQYALEKRNVAKALSIVQEALEAEEPEEQMCANLIIIARTFGLPIFEFLQQFLQLFPNSLYPIRVLLAEILVESDNYDDATSEARYFLRVVQENGKIGQKDDAKLEEYTMKAYLLSTSVYVAVGARSYAERVIRTALQYAPENWIKLFEGEITHLHKELQEEKLKTQNEKWEAFFATGEHFDELYQRCAENRFTELAIRLRLLQDERNNNIMQPIDDREVTRVVMVDGQGDYLLG